MKKLSEHLLAFGVAAVFALQYWTLKEVVALKVSVAQIETRLAGSHISHSPAPYSPAHILAQLPCQK